MKSSDFRDLIVWQKSMSLAKEVYTLVKLLPREETYVLSDQMRRAVVSVASNIAEGHGRDSSKEFVRFLSVARGSLRELATQLELCILCGYLNQTNVINANSLIVEVDKMLTALSSKLTTKN
jgi:four helix bundle protein